MPNRTSAGLLMYRVRNGEIEVFLAHPGGPFFQKKDDGHWTIPKGEVDQNDGLLETARREFQEEVGIEPGGEFLPLGSIRQKGGKSVHAWAFEGDCAEARSFRSNTFKMEWPPGSGALAEFPEVDRAEFFPLEDARKKIKETQRPLLDRLDAVLRPKIKARAQP
ncbi:MAG TPA: NUDIX domain-containing protein [Candidatus Eisenbacteria bacterium]|nr:NUDIX domain-containing protein [Candidatus Eisenbacteria bacterium]